MSEPVKLSHDLFPHKKKESRMAITEAHQSKISNRVKLLKKERIFFIAFFQKKSTPIASAKTYRCNGVPGGTYYIVNSIIADTRKKSK